MRWTGQMTRKRESGRMGSRSWGGGAPWWQDGRAPKSGSSPSPIEDQWEEPYQDAWESFEDSAWEETVCPSGP